MAKRATDTKERIVAVARELFAQRGVQKTSLADIAEQLGITKPALYYHFESREALLAAILQPLLDDMDAFIAGHEAEPLDVRALLSDYFDLLQRNGDLLTALVRDLATLGIADLTTRMIAWRHRLIALMLGPDASQDAQVRAVVAIGGLSDCVVEFPVDALPTIKATAVEAACAALGVPPAKPARRKRSS